MDLGISGRVALVTASSKGLGRASALALADEGCKVVVCARGEEALRATEKELANRTEVLAIVDDITEPAAPGRVVKATVERFGSIDILVPNAGGHHAVDAPQQPAIADADLPSAGRDPEEQQSARGPLQEDRRRVELDHRGLEQPKGGAAIHL